MKGSEVGKVLSEVNVIYLNIYLFHKKSPDGPLDEKRVSLSRFFFVYFLLISISFLKTNCYWLNDTYFHAKKIIDRVKSIRHLGNHFVWNAKCLSIPNRSQLSQF